MTSLTLPSALSMLLIDNLYSFDAALFNGLSNKLNVLVALIFPDTHIQERNENKYNILLIKSTKYQWMFFLETRTMSTE